MAKIMITSPTIHRVIRPFLVFFAIMLSNFLKFASFRCLFRFTLYKIFFIYRKSLFVCKLMAVWLCKTLAELIGQANKVHRTGSTPVAN